jgi:hypothetical protein
MNHALTTQKIARRAGLVAAVASLALMIAPAAGLAAAPVKFGAKLDPLMQPSNSLPGLRCAPERIVDCTMVQNEAYGRAEGGELAPRTGRIKRIRLIAGAPGVFRLQVAKVRHPNEANDARVVANGQKIRYQGQTEANWESGVYRIETFKVDVPIKKGQQLAMHTNGTQMSAIRCSSGGANTLIYEGGLNLREPFAPATDSDGCWILMEAVIR